MLMMVDKASEEKPDDLFTPAEAAAYLAKRWGRKSFSVEGLRALRGRIGLVPAHKTTRMSMYTRQQLDEIEAPAIQGRYTGTVDKTEN